MTKEENANDKPMEISTDNSLEENMKIGAALLEKQQNEGEKDNAEDEEKGSGIDKSGSGKAGKESGKTQKDGDDESDDEADDGESDDDETAEKGLDWSKAPPELKKAYRRQMNETKNLKTKLKNSISTVERLVQKVQDITSGDEKNSAGKESDKGGKKFDPNNPPDKELDPDAYDAWEREKDNRERQEIKAEQAVIVATQHFNESANDVTPELKEFSEAMLRRAILKKHPNAAKDDIAKAIKGIMLETAYVAHKKGQKYADYLLEQAEIYGFDPKAKKQNSDKSSGRDERKGTGKPNMERIKENSEDKQSLGDAGSSFRGRMTIDDLDAMEKDELADFMRKNPKEFQRIMAEVDH